MKRAIGAVALCLTLTASACGDDKGTTSQGTTATTAVTTSVAAPTTTTKAPQRGGTLTIGQFSAPPGLDPTKLPGGGCCGGTEHMAIYDALMRYNPETLKYEPRTAESLTPNADYSVWTLKIRPNIKFTDGNPYDANAVKYVHDRELAEGNAAPKGQFQSSVAKVEVVDNLTVRYTLIKPWTGFPFVLASINGIIYSPAAQQKAGANFNTAPSEAGAGPFKVKSYKPGEALDLERNPNYWGGDVYLDGLKFVLIPGGTATYDALKGGTIQAAGIRDNTIPGDAKKNGFGVIEMPGVGVGGNMLQMNASKGATANIKVRQAVAHAVDPKVIVDRVYNGAGLANSAPFANSPWDPKVEGRKYDPAEARRLIAEAKAQGYDGKIRVLAANTPEGTSWGVAVQTMLQAVGFDVALDTSKDGQSVVTQVLVQQDYEIAQWALGVTDESDGNYLPLAQTFAGKRYGYGPQDMVDAVDKLRTATNDSERVAAYKAISDIWIRDVPAHVTNSVMFAWVYASKVHGTLRTSIQDVLLDKAWIER